MGLPVIGAQNVSCLLRLGAVLEDAEDCGTSAGKAGSQRPFLNEGVLDVPHDSGTIGRQGIGEDVVHPPGDAWQVPRLQSGENSLRVRAAGIGRKNPNPQRYICSILDFCGLVNTQFVILKENFDLCG